VQEHGTAHEILPQASVAASTVPQPFTPASFTKQVIPPEHSIVRAAVTHGPASSHDFDAQHACASQASNAISTSEGSQPDGLKSLGPLLPVGLQRLH
jgi:hypothetical protein